MTLQIEEGKFYRTRNGRKAGPAEYRAEGTSEVYPWSVPMSSTDAHAVYMDDGRYQRNGHWPEFDLVAEWVDEPIVNTPEMETFGELAQSKQEAGSKFDAGKARLDLLAPEFLTGTAEILDFGARKYGERNWEAGMSWSRPFAALMRHMWAWWAGEEKDAETGKSHLWHAACCLMFLIAFEARGAGKDDRAKISH